MRGDPAHPPFVFFDLETTGLSGGAGTYAFLVGCGAFDAEGGFRHAAVRPAAARRRTAVAAGGRRGAGACRGARQLQREIVRRSAARDPASLPPSRVDAAVASRTSTCSIRPAASGARVRQGLLPVRWRHWNSRCSERGGLATCPGSRFPPATSSSSARAMRGRSSACSKHNRLDLLSLAGLTARLLDLVRTGPGAARHPREALALGRVYARCGLEAVRARPISALLACARSGGAHPESTAFARLAALCPAGPSL